MEPEKNCKNCIYFYQHYYKSESGRFHKVFNDGYCSNDKLTKPLSRKIVSKYLPCEFWQPIEKQSYEKRENIFKMLCEINYRLNEITSILIDEKD